MTIEYKPSTHLPIGTRFKYDGKRPYDNHWREVVSDHEYVLVGEEQYKYEIETNCAGEILIDVRFPKEDGFSRLYQTLKDMKGKTQQYYDKNPAAKKVKAAKDKEINARPEQRKKRSELNKANRKAGSYGNNDKKDLSHTKNGLVLKSEKSNRGSKKDQPGDKRARG